MVVVLTALGLGPASFLRPSLGRSVRLFFSPVLGLAIGTSIFSTLIWFVPASSTFWLVPILALASSGVAVWRAAPRRDQSLGPPALFAKARSGRQRGTPIAVAAMQVVAMAVIVVGPATAITAYRHSVGPVAFRVDDVVGYVAETDAMQHDSLRTLENASAPWSNLVLAYADRYARAPQNIDFAPLSANVNELFGWGSTETQSGFLLAVIFAGAMGVSGALIYVTRRRSWLTALGGGVFGAALFTQLFFDGSQAAICGLALILPLAVIALEAIRFRRIEDHVLFAILLAGLIAVYPLFIPGFVLAALIVLIALGVRNLSNPDRTWVQSLFRASRSIAFIAFLAVALDLVAFRRDLTYWRGVLHGGFVSIDDPRYALNLFTIPSWLSQARGTYVLSLASHSLFSNLFFALLIPLIILAVISLGGLRNNLARLLAAVIVGYGILAIYSGTRHIAGSTMSCSYCVDRDLLPLGPVIGFLAILGVAGVVVSGNALVRCSVVAAAGLVLAATTYALVSELQLVYDNAFFLDTSVSSVLSHYPNGAPPLELEGFDESPNAIAEELIVADEAEEHSWGHVSLPADYSDNDSLAYIGSTQPLSDPQFRPAYGYVLTRLSGVTTARPVVARSGGIALERRERALDVLVDSGVLVGFLQSSANGQADINTWNPEPIRFIVTGDRGMTTSVNVVLGVNPKAPPMITSPDSRDLSIHRDGMAVYICVEPRSTSTIRVVALTVTPAVYVNLAAVSATTGGCEAAAPSASTTGLAADATRPSHNRRTHQNALARLTRSAP